MRKTLLMVFVASLFICLPIYSHAALYKWVDKNGELHITDYPNPSATEDYEKREPAKKPSDSLKDKITDKSKPEKPAAEPAKKAEPLKLATPQALLQNTSTAAVVNAVAPKAPVVNASISNMPAPVAANMPAPRPVQPMLDEIPPLAGGALLALIAGLGMLILIIPLVLYLLVSFCLFKIAQKLNVDKPWLSFIPIANLYIMVACAGKPWWWMLLALIPLVGLFIMIYVWMLIAENLGKNKLLGLIMLVPLVNLAFMAWLAFSSGGAKPKQFEMPPSEMGESSEMPPAGETPFESSKETDDNPFKDM